MSNFETYVANLEKSGSPEELQLLAEARARFKLASSLLDRRQARGLSQRDLADASGVPQSEISKIESGGANPTVKTLNSIGHALGIRLSWELTETSS